MKNYSFWFKDNKSSIKEEKIPCEIVDIVIIGGGITGVSLSYFLKDTNKKVVLINQTKIGDNATGKSTAKISFVQRDIYQKLEKTLGYDTAKKYYESQIYAINLIKEIIEKNHINCDFSSSNSYLFTNLSSKVKDIEKEKKLLTSFGRKCFDESNLPIKFPCLKAFYTEDNYTFHPIKYLNQLLKIVESKIDIVEGLLVEEVISKNKIYEIRTEKGIIKARKVVVANQYPFFISPGFIPFKNYVQREYICAAKYKSGEIFNAINIEKDLHSIRFYQDYIIYVSNSHRIINKLDTKKNYQKSRDDFSKFFHINPEYQWLNQDLITNDHLPIIGQVKKNLFIATGYNAWGMTNGILAAKIISDLIRGKDNLFTQLVDPNRKSAVGLMNSIIDSLSYIKPYLESPLHNKNIYIEKKDGVKYNVYVDKSGVKHYAKRKCPHLKCNLLFNEEELTWDCPCHGSRFDLDGRLIEGPSKKNI